MNIDQLIERPLSFSSIKEFAKSPAHFIMYREQKKDPTPDMVLGSLIHSLILEPSKIEDNYVISEKLDMRKSADKEKMRELEEQANGRVVVQRDVFDFAYSLAEKAISNDSFISEFHGASIEQSEYINIEGLPFVRKIDLSNENSIIDVKTMKDATYSKINREFFENKMYLQASIYKKGSHKRFYYFIIEKSQPFYNGLIGVSNEYLVYGDNELSYLCSAFHYCLENPECFRMSYDFWDKFNGTTPIVSLPSWVK